MRRTWIEHLVNTVTDSHDFLLLRQRVFKPWVNVRLAADLLEHVNDAFVRTTMQRAFQRANRARDRGEHIAQRRHGDARAERARVHAVVRMQNVGYIQCIGRLLSRSLAV